MKITFLGAAETVTGSKYLLTVGKKNILVDCGLFQGKKDLRLRNWEKLPIKPARINAVILTHAHIDHSGYVPLLVKNGFKGKVYCTHATKDLCAILLPDSGFLQEESANYANKYGFSKHKPANPLYTENEAIISLEYLVGLEFGKKYQLFDGVSFQFNRAGHILGASTLDIYTKTSTLLFSGDLGRQNDPIMRPPVAQNNADYLILESTYGDRLHKGPDPQDEIADVVNRTAERGGTILVPSFAVGRAQMILFYLHELKRANRIPDIPVFLDSPMAIDATNIFHNYVKEHKLTPAQAEQVCKTAQYVNTVEQSKLIDTYKIPIIIISASGMATGGRVLHHLRTFAPDARNTIMFTGYQAEGTRGDTLVRQHKREVKLFGEMVGVNAEVVNLRNISSHADYDEILLWLENFTTPPRKVFITHGESEAAHALCAKIVERLHWNCIVPGYLQLEQLL